jgi:hypothetical protein
MPGGVSRTWAAAPLVHTPLSARLAIPTAPPDWVLPPVEAGGTVM